MGTETVGGPESQLTVDISGTPIVCGDEFGMIQANVSGNTAAVHYEWTKDGVGALADTLALIDSATVGLYTVVITSDGCTASDQFFLGNNLPVLTPFSENVSCFGENNGNASVTPNGGELPYSYLWYSLNGSPLLATTTDSLQDNLFAGDYVVTVSEGSGCISSYEFNITQPPLLQVIATVENADCSNDFAGSIEIDITGGIAPYLVLWENGDISTTLTGLSADNYNLSVTDSNVCSLQQTITVNQTDLPLVVNFLATAPTCGNADGLIASNVISSNGMVDYLWNGITGEAISSNLTAGTYSVDYTDGQCYGSSEIILPSIGGPQIDSARVVPVSCYGGNDGEIQLYWTASANSVTFLWSDADANSSQNLINAIAGAYTVVLTDENLCTYTAAYELSQPDSIEINITSQDNVCFGASEGNVDFVIAGGNPPYTLNWLGMNYTDSFSFVALAAGNYPYQFSDAAGCSQTGSIDIQEPDAIHIDFQTVDITCSNSVGSITSVITGGTQPYSFNWNTGDSLDFI
ncbi:MAG: SprB repeat-containing protein, partial [Flavobacteriales bacterium]